MSPSKRHLTLLSLCLTVGLALAAIDAVSAQAQGNWRIQGANITAVKEVESEEDAMFTLLFTFGLSNVRILCNTRTVDDGLLFIGGGSLGTFLLNQCTTTLNGMPSTPCTPVNQPVKLGFKGLLIEHNNKTYNLISPDEPGLKFGTFEMGATCTLGQEVALEGHLVLEDCTNEFETEVKKHLMQQASVTLFASDVLKIGPTPPNAVPATIDGSFWLKLKGLEAGKLWSAKA